MARFRRSDCITERAQPGHGARYAGRPLLRPVDLYVLDAVALLADDDRAKVEGMTSRLRETLGSTASTWQGVLGDALRLPATFHKDVRTQWAEQSAAAAATGQTISADDYAAAVAESFED